VTRGRTRDAIHLPEEQRLHLIAKYAGTRTEAQELDGLLLEDIEGALWTRQLFDATRVGAAPPMSRVVVAMDPAATSHEESDEMGILVAGLGQQYLPDLNGTMRQHGYLLDDLSGRMPPIEAARTAIRAYHKHRADAIVVEVNNGGEWITSTIRQIDPSVNVRTVHATRGKLTRAEPVAAVFEQHAAHVVGSLPEFEEQCVTWVPGDSSPDRLDGGVWAFTDLMLASAGNLAAVA
jgi:predicted phage terminase large subunit-like protein